MPMRTLACDCRVSGVRSFPMGPAKSQMKRPESGIILRARRLVQASSWLNYGSHSSRKELGKSQLYFFVFKGKCTDDVMVFK